MPPTHIPEASLLRHVDPSQHSDDWPVLELSGCDIFVQEKGDRNAPVTPDLSRGLVSLLEADNRNPLLIRGILKSVSRDLSHIRLRPSLGTELLQVEGVRQYAYGQYEDGRVELWAAGTAAWYSIRPSRAYKAIFERTIEAVEVLYFCVDIIGGKGTKSRKGKAKGNITTENLLTRYATLKGATQHAAEAAFDRHSRFLLGCMLSGKENIDWMKTDLWEWMIDRYPETYQELNESKKRSTEPSSKVGTKRKRSSTRPVERSVRRASNQKSASTTSSLAHSSSRSSQHQPTTPRTSSPLDDSDTDSITVPGRKTRARKGKSTLRPRTSKFVSLESSDSIKNDGKDLERRSSSTSAVAHSTLPSSQLPLTRRSRRNNLLDLDDSAMSEEPFDEGIDMSLDQSHDSESDAPSELLIPPATGTGKPIAFRLREEHLSATGEGDVWACPLDGCMHHVYAASKPESQILIKEHYRRHVNDEDAEMRLDLVRKMQTPGVPVNRLMSRIQALVGQKGFPTPIIRRY